MCRSRVALSLVLAAVLVTAACSSSSSGDAAEPSRDDAATTSTTSGPGFDPEAVGAVTVEGPVTGGEGTPVLAQGTPDLAAKGYVEEEFFLTGEASAFTSDEALTSDGRWTVERGGTADYTTRVLVRRPGDAADFNGTVVVEWLNVTGGLDAPAMYTLTQVELLRTGAAWIGVSAQQAGISGSGGLGDRLRLKNADPERYAPLDHPGDDFSYDLFAQVGGAVRTQPDVLLGGLEPEVVLATGESQSAFRLSTYVNAVQPGTGAYDGFLVVSRADPGAALAEDTGAPVAAPDPTLVRDDLATPVLVLSSETDLGDGIGYDRGRQPDTDTFRGWEVAGTAHYDAYGLTIGAGDEGTGEGDAALFAALTDPPSAIYGGVIECDRPFNAGPFTYAARAAVAALDTWVRTGEPPPEMPRLTVEDGAPVADRDGNAEGGIRTPQLDVPLATLSGSGQPPNGFCGLFGTTVPFDEATRVERYGDHAGFVAEWDAAVDAAVASGAVLEADAEHLKQAAAQADVLGG